MYLHALIGLCVIGIILASINLFYIFLWKRKFNQKNNETKVKSGKNNKPKSMKEINNQVRTNFVKAILKTNIMKALLIIDGCFFTVILVLIGVFIWI